MAQDTNIWSTKRVDDLLKQVEESGVMPKRNPFFEKDVDLRAKGVNFQYTSGELLEMARVSEDILHFGEVHCKVRTDDGDRFMGKGGLRKYQIKALLQLKKYQFNVWLASRQIGKCVSYDSEVELYDRAKDSMIRMPIFEAHYRYKRRMRRMDSVELAIWRMRAASDRRGWVFVSSVLRRAVGAAIWLNWRLWKYDMGEHEIVSSSVPVSDIYAKSIRSKHSPITATHMRTKYEMWSLELVDGTRLECAGDHRVFLADGAPRRVRDLKKGLGVVTEGGMAVISRVGRLGYSDYCFDLTVASEDRSYFANGILSHNSIVSGIFIVWYLLTSKMRNVLITSQNEDKVTELVDKIDTILKGLPFYMKLGIVHNTILKKKFDNGCRLIAQTTTENSGASYTVHLLYCDEFALIHKNFLAKFFRTTFPTLSSSDIARMIITSTPRGMNKFYDVYNDAIGSKNRFNPIRTDWYEVPLSKKELLKRGYSHVDIDSMLKAGTVPGRDEEWRQEQISDLGSEEDFNQEYGNQFLAGNTLLFKSSMMKKLKGWETEFVHRRIEELDDIGVPYEGALRWHPQFDMESLKSPSCKFVISVDLAEGGGGDFSVANLFQLMPMSVKEIESMSAYTEEKDFFKLVQVGMFRDNNTQIPELAKLFYHLVLDVIVHENVKCVLETNYDGNYFMEKVNGIEGHDNRIEEDHLFVSFPYDLQWENALTFKTGIKQSEKSKTAACKVIKDKVSHGQLVITEKRTIEESMSFSKNKSGNYEGQLANDDAVMTCVNVIHFYATPDFVEQIDELLEHISKDFIRLVNQKLNRRNVEDESGIEDYF